MSYLLPFQVQAQLWCRHECWAIVVTYSARYCMFCLNYLILRFVNSIDWLTVRRSLRGKKKAFYAKGLQPAIRQVVLCCQRPYLLVVSIILKLQTVVMYHLLSDVHLRPSSQRIISVVALCHKKGQRPVFCADSTHVRLSYVYSVPIRDQTVVWILIKFCI